MADLYSKYCNYLKGEELNDSNNRYTNFKNHESYTYMLEHVTEDLGEKYLRHIFDEFDVSITDVVKYLLLNDSFGNPVKSNYFTKDGGIISCSPTSLRYTYQALVILKHYKTTDCENMVELGCGYGGLFMAIDYFATLLDIKINKYNMVDLPEPNTLIEFYLNLHKENVKTPYELHKAEDYGSTVPSGKLFFISNYCYTEIDTEHKEKYYNSLLKRADSGFIIWQTICFDIEYMNQIIQTPKEIIIEKPQTCFDTKTPNYFVFF